LDDVAAEAEVIHDVFERPGMLKTDGMSEFVNASEIDDRLTKQSVLSRAVGYGAALSANLRHHVDNRPCPAVELELLGFSVQTLVRRNPTKADERPVDSFRGDEFQLAAAFPRPCLESQFRQFVIGIPISGHSFAVLDKVRQVLTSIESSKPSRLR